MINLCSVIMVALLTAPPITSHATNWRGIGTVDSQFGLAEVELDTDSIKQFTNTRIREELGIQFYSKVRSAWFRMSFSPVEIRGQEMSSGLMRININCDTSHTQTEAMIVFSRPRGKGKRLGATDDDYRTQWVDIVPNTLQDLARDELCKR